MLPQLPPWINYLKLLSALAWVFRNTADSKLVKSQTLETFDLGQKMLTAFVWQLPKSKVNPVNQILSIPRYLHHFTLQRHLATSSALSLILQLTRPPTSSSHHPPPPPSRVVSSASVISVRCAAVGCTQITLLQISKWFSLPSLGVSSTRSPSQASAKHRCKVVTRRRLGLATSTERCETIQSMVFVSCSGFGGSIRSRSIQRSSSRRC